MPDREVSAAEVEALARDLESRGESFVRVTVVRREPPVSANVGDTAVVTSDGQIHGWVGGANCAQDAVRREAEHALADGEPRFVGLAPDPEDIEREGLEAFPMTCHSGGTLELFLAPVVPQRDLLVVGATPVAWALADLVADLDFRVTVVADEPPEGRDERIVAAEGPEAIAAAVRGAPYVVVVSMDATDADAVAAALSVGAPYVGLVASERRAAEVTEQAARRLDVDAETVREAVTTPAGIDIGAETPAEIAVSILAQLVAVRRGKASANEVAAALVERSTGGVAVDPVCGMDVDTGSPAATVEYEGETYYFCSEGCAAAFERTPAEYLSAEP